MWMDFAAIILNWDPKRKENRSPPVFDPLQSRRRTPEIMDGPDLPPAEHTAALAGLERLNRLALHARPFWKIIAPLAASAPPAQPLRVLDLAAGGGGLVLGLRRYAQRTGFALEVDGCDRSPTAVAFAQARATRAGLHGGHFFACDLLGDGVPSGYDVVVNSLFLHHLDEAEAIAFLRDAAAKATRLALISDILRTHLGLLMVRVACPLLGGSRIVVEDGLSSLHAAFTHEELRTLAARAGFSGISPLRHWPQRALLRLPGGAPAQS